MQRMWCKRVPCCGDDIGPSPTHIPMLPEWHSNLCFNRQCQMRATQQYWQHTELYAAPSRPVWYHWCTNTACASHSAITQQRRRLLQEQLGA